MEQRKSGYNEEIAKTFAANERIFFENPRKVIKIRNGLLTKVYDKDRGIVNGVICYNGSEYTCYTVKIGREFVPLCYDNLGAVFKPSST